MIAMFLKEMQDLPVGYVVCLFLLEFWVGILACFNCFCASSFSFCSFSCLCPHMLTPSPPSPRHCDLTVGRRITLNRVRPRLGHLYIGEFVDYVSPTQCDEPAVESHDRFSRVSLAQDGSSVPGSSTRDIFNS
jgi:hypothetical protein